jgi:acetyl esterase/lipase
VSSVHYGQHASQCADVYLPAGPGPHPVVALLHGGFRYVDDGRDRMRPLAADLARHGFAAVNLEYRRLSEPGGGWPGTLLDAVAGVDFANWPAQPRACAGFDTERVAVVGHSSGGQLAFWAAAWLAAMPRTDGAERKVEVRAAVSLAGLLDLRRGARDALDCRQSPLPASVELLGGYPDEADGRYRLGSPIELLPIGHQVAQLLVHGEDDEVVPIEDSRRYARRAAEAGDRVRLACHPHTGHLDLLDPVHPAWRGALAHLREHLGPERVPGVRAT